MAQESVWKGPLMGFELLCWHGGCGVSRNDHTLHYGLSGQVVRGERGRFHPSPFNGEGLPAPIVKKQDRCRSLDFPSNLYPLVVL